MPKIVSPLNRSSGPEYLSIDTSQRNTLRLVVFSRLGIQAKKTVTTLRPESHQLLFFISRLLKQRMTPVSSLRGIVVVIGPGGFSALRVGIVCANIFGRVLNIPVLGQTKTGATESLKDLVNLVPQLEAMRQFTPVMPQYGQAPNITVPRR